MVTEYFATDAPYIGVEHCFHSNTAMHCPLKLTLDTEHNSCFEELGNVKVKGGRSELELGWYGGAFE